MNFFLFGIISANIFLFFFTMTDFLPLFPLQMVVFPGELLNLHIFEPRYRQLVRECHTNRTTFGIPCFLKNKITEIGTEIKLLSIEKRYPNGEMDIKTQALGRFVLQDFYNETPGKLYAGADVERLEEEDIVGNFNLKEEIFEKLMELFSMMGVQKTPNFELAAFSTFSAGHYIGLSLEEEYELLKILGEENRQHFVLSQLNKLIPTMREVENLKNRVKMNGHFKNIVPPNF